MRVFFRVCVFLRCVFLNGFGLPLLFLMTLPVNLNPSFTVVGGLLPRRALSFTGWSLGRCGRRWCFRCSYSWSMDVRRPATRARLICASHTSSVPHAELASIGVGSYTLSPKALTIGWQMSSPYNNGCCSFSVTVTRFGVPVQTTGGQTVQNLAFPSGTNQLTITTGRPTPCLAVIEWPAADCPGLARATHASHTSRPSQQSGVHVHRVHGVQWPASLLSLAS